MVLVSSKDEQMMGESSESEGQFFKKSFNPVVFFLVGFFGDGLGYGWRRIFVQWRRWNGRLEDVGESDSLFFRLFGI